MRSLWVLLVVMALGLALSGCAVKVYTYPVRAEQWPGSSGKHPYPGAKGSSVSTQPAPKDGKGQRGLERVLRVAQALMDKSGVKVDGREFNADCSGFVRACYWSAGVDLFPLDPEGSSGTAIIWNHLKDEGRTFRVGQPQPGDLIFFDNTWDRNGNGRLDDSLTHIGLVTEIDARGIVHFAHYAGGKVKEGRLDLSAPGLYADPSTGEVHNDYLRRRSSSDVPGTRYLAGGLFAGFGRPPREWLLSS